MQHFVAVAFSFNFSFDDKRFKVFMMGSRSEFSYREEMQVLLM